MSEDMAVSSGLHRTDLGAVLLEVSSLTQEQLEEARKERESSGGRLAEHLLSAGHVTAEEVMEAYSRQLGLPIRARIFPHDVDSDLLERLPITFAKERGVLPLHRDPEGALHVAVTTAAQCPSWKTCTFAPAQPAARESGAVTQSCEQPWRVIASQCLGWAQYCPIGRIHGVRTAPHAAQEEGEPCTAMRDQGRPFQSCQDAPPHRTGPCDGAGYYARSPSCR